MKSGTVVYVRCKYHAPSSEHGCCQVYPVDKKGKPVQSDWVLRDEGYDKQVTTVVVGAVVALAELERAAAALAMENR